MSKILGDRLNIIYEDTLLEITPELMKKTIIKQDKEIERLNNIINELENEFDSVIKDPLIHMCYKRLARKYADKLQELKGSDKK